MEELEVKVKGIWEECTSPQETPRPHPDAIDQYVYTVSIKNKKVPLGTLRNLYYQIIAGTDMDSAYQRRQNIMDRYKLESNDVIVYARPSLPAMPRS